MQPNRTVNNRLDDIEKLLKTLGTSINSSHIDDTFDRNINTIDEKLNSFSDNIESTLDENSNKVTEKLNNFSNNIEDNLKKLISHAFEDMNSLSLEWLELCKYGMKSDLKPSMVLEIMKVLNHYDE